MASRRPRRASRAPDAAGPRSTGGGDLLRLRAIRAYGHLGVPARERALGQRVEADVELIYPALSRRRTDSLRDAIDYETVHRFVRDRLARMRRRLIETAAEELALALLRTFPASRVRVRLRKLHVPVADFEVIPEVEVERHRS